MPRLRTAPAVVVFRFVVDDEGEEEEDGDEEEGTFSRTSYWSPLVTTRSPSSFARTSIHAMTRFVSPSWAFGFRSTIGLGGSLTSVPSVSRSQASRIRRPASPDFSGWN